MTSPLVTVITATTGNKLLKDCIESVMLQTHRPIQHLIFVDGPLRKHDSAAIVNSINNGASLKREGYRLDIVDLPYPVGTDRWNGHRMYGAGSYLADGDFIIYLDDDNYLDYNHVEECLNVIATGKDWSYSLRRLVDSNRTILGLDDCESLGKWASVLHPQDYFVDVNCYFIPRMLAVGITPLWFRKFREPGQPEIDRVICQALRQHAPNFECSYKYSVNYTVGNTPLSVQPDFFKFGNEEMLKRYNGVLPWRK
jgi:hypothetical protein